MSNYVDVMGREVDIGDTVAYTANTNKCAHLRVGTVLQAGCKIVNKYNYKTDKHEDTEQPFIQVFVEANQLPRHEWTKVKKSYKMRVYAPHFVIVKKNLDLENGD
jgi:hypothetical protein